MANNPDGLKRAKQKTEPLFIKKARENPESGLECIEAGTFLEDVNEHTDVKTYDKML